MTHGGIIFQSLFLRLNTISVTPLSNVIEKLYNLLLLYGYNLLCGYKSTTKSECKCINEIFKIL